MNTKNKVVATLITLSAFMTLTACSVAPQADSFRDVGGITSNVTSDGTENPHDLNFATKAGKVVNEKLDGFVNSENAKNAEETISNSMNEETAKASYEKQNLIKQIKNLKNIISEYKKHPLYYAKDVPKLKKQYNDIFNEGGEGYIPTYYTYEQLAFFEKKLLELIASTKERS